MSGRTSKGTWTAILVALTITFMASLWMIDISVSAMRISLQGYGEAKLSNGFWVRDPGQAYHIALWLAIGTFFTNSVVAIKLLLGGEDK